MSDQLMPITDESERQKLGERLRDARKYLGLTQEEVSNSMGIQRTALVDIESGQRRVEAIELTHLAKLFKQPVEYFLGQEASTAELPADVAHLARQAKELSEKDREELSRFAEYLSVRSRTEHE